MQKPAQKRMLQEFVKQFTTEQVYHDLEVMSKSFYEIPSSLKKITDSIHQEFFCAGEFLGKIEKSRFIPSVGLLNRLASVSDRKVVIGDKSAWLFVCGRDIMPKAIKKQTVEEGVVIILDLQDNVLGYGIISNQPGIAIKNIWDIGDFLRRER